MKFFKYCVASPTADKLPNVLDAFEDAEPRTSEVYDSTNHNGNCSTSRDTSRDFRDNLVWLRNCEQEVVEPLAGELTGNIPKWLKGTLLRNGLGSLKVGEHTFQHLFDGSALVHRFRIENGEVTYQSRFVQSDAYKENKAAQRIVFTEFGTKSMPDPCRSIFHRVSSMFSQEELTDNTMVSVYPFGDEFYTITEMPVMHRIDPTTLQTINKVKLTDYINIVHHTAHPLVMSDGTVYNIGMGIRRRKLQYNVVCFYPRREITDKAGNKKELSMFDQATYVASIPCRRQLNPSYMHSFGITDNYFIIVVQPLTLSISKMMIKRQPPVSSLKWHKNKSTLIHVISRGTGRLVRTFVSETFFFFHIINQFETRDEQYVVLDICCYRDSKLIEHLYVESVKNLKEIPDLKKLLGGKPLRFVLPMKRTHAGIPPDHNLITVETVHQNLVKQLVPNVVDHIANGTNCNVVTDCKVDCKNALQRKPTAHRLSDGSFFVKPELLCDLWCEMPRINDSSHLGKEYRYFYAISYDTDFNNATTIIKVDTYQKTVKTWQEEDVIANEPIFVANPNGKNEDDGVVVSSLIWMKNYENRVALLILDAATFTEIARATFDTPGPVPKCLHGWFSLDKQISVDTIE
ncbi:PREDICTED: carotenoid isomerooxygenase-like isoform X2 [Dinoponera quadriceps]|uniref:Carotenoid isomerooxygenase-like isoform X2 n=1 Tax=Dinoponera quadriceps TaxID=609295 RepID=A0A6P3X2C5_DINQU|nr:PREDICTED: carotenoid isomerooxygenase-like isoform X2 [Dinoponera quadriceps]